MPPRQALLRPPPAPSPAPGRHSCFLPGCMFWMVLRRLPHSAVHVPLPHHRGPGLTLLGVRAPLPKHLLLPAFTRLRAVGPGPASRPEPLGRESRGGGGWGGQCREGFLGESVLISDGGGRLPHGHGAPSGACVSWVFAQPHLPAPGVLGAPRQLEGVRQVGAGIWTLCSDIDGALSTLPSALGAPGLRQAPERPGDP